MIMKSRTVVLIVLALTLVSFLVVSAGGGGGWELVVDAEARSGGTVVATRQFRTSACEGDGEGACVAGWDWAGESLPADAEEWVRPRFIVNGVDVPVVYVPCWCDVGLHRCRASMTDAGTVIEPSAECLAELADVCGLEPDGRGFWPAGTLPKTGDGYYAFYGPLGAEWYDSCPSPPPTWTPYVQPTYTPYVQPTYTPEPTPICRPTSTPRPTYTPLPLPTLLPTSTPHPTQPPF